MAGGDQDESHTTRCHGSDTAGSTGSASRWTASPRKDRDGSRTKGGSESPVFQVDPLWPKPLPNQWVMGSVIGVSVDSQDRIWMLHRPSSLSDNEKAAALDPPLAPCCFPAPPILVFDQEGSLVDSWGGPGAGYDWPASEHGLYVDCKDNVWVGGNAADDRNGGPSRE